MRMQAAFKCMTVVLLVAITYSCNKKHSEPAPVNNNQINAIASFYSGRTMVFNTKKDSAKMGCGYYGLSTDLESINADNSALIINVSVPELHCITEPGTYSAQFDCQVREEIYYGAMYVSQRETPGNITFEVINQGYMEGHFEIICFSDHDTALVTGTFKGDHLY